MKIIRKRITPVTYDEMFKFKPESEPLEDHIQDKILSILFEEDAPLSLGDATFAKVFNLDTKDKPESEDRRSFRREIDWRSMTVNGSLIKRIRSLMYKKLKIKLSPQKLEKFCGVIAANIVTSKEYALDITRKFDWKSGDFGDTGSCFFGCRSGIRKDMEADGAFSSLRFFQKYNKDFASRKGGSKYYKDYAGIGRSWLWATKIKTEVSKDTTILADVYVLFNGTGPVTKWQAQFLSAYLNLPIKLVNVVNKGKAKGGLYVNSGIGYILGEESVISSVTTLDLGMDVHHCKNYRS